MNPEKKYILSIESSGKVCGIALLSFENNRLNFENNNFENNNILTNFELLSEYNIYVGNKHDRFLAELCHRILNDNDLRVDDLSGVAVSIGPGSFTGLRIGSALAKGLCFTVDEENEVDEKNEENKTHSIKLIAVPTLKALAYRVNEFLKSVNYFENNIDNPCGNQHECEVDYQTWQFHYRSSLCFMF
jgi:tRNA threonylcarbamoyl adenosine modification protein YeaZ